MDFLHEGHCLVVSFYNSSSVLPNLLFELKNNKLQYSDGWWKICFRTKFIDFDDQSETSDESILISNYQLDSKYIKKSIALHEEKILNHFYLSLSEIITSKARKKILLN